MEKTLILLYMVTWVGYYIPTTTRVYGLAVDSLSCTSKLHQESTSSTGTPTEILSHGAWNAANAQLINPDCCVVSVGGLETCLSTLQEHFVEHSQALRNVDLRARIRMSSSSDNREDTLSDCQNVYDMVMGNKKNQHQASNNDDPCILALAELAEGISTALHTTGGGEQKWKQDVFMRVVCA